MRSTAMIPTETLCDIFLLLCDKPIDLCELKNELRFDEFPWAVGQVCRHWRGAFLSYPHLWTSFSLYPVMTNTGYLAEMKRRAAIYIERSGHQPLNITVPEPCSESTQLPQTVWIMLLSFLQRWKTADLTMGSGAALNELLRCDGGTVTNLESLKMSISFGTPPGNYDAFGVAPRLTELQFEHFGHTNRWRFPWAQLTKLSLFVSSSELSRGPANVLDVLLQLRDIEELRVFADRSRIIAPLGTSIVLLPRLRFLEISFYPMLFSRFTAPLLENLRICGRLTSFLRGPDLELCEREFTSFIRRSSCQVRRLNLQFCDASKMRMVIKALPSVENLYIYFPNGSKGMFDECVNLSKLEIFMITARVCDAEYIVGGVSRFLEARTEESMPLDTLTIWLESEDYKNPAPTGIPDDIVEITSQWPPFAEVYVNGWALDELFDLSEN